MPLNLLPTTDFSLDTITSIIFLVLLGAYIIYSTILYYHWQAYGTNAAVGWLTGVIYLASTLPLLIIMGLLTLTF